jgi:hypothetical protein
LAFRPEPPKTPVRAVEGVRVSDHTVTADYSVAFQRIGSSKNASLITR